MAGTTQDPTFTATVEAATLNGSAARKAILLWGGGGPLTREQKRLVAQLLHGSLLGRAFSRIAGVYL